MIMDKSENENGYYIFEEKITKMIIMIDNNNFIANEKNTKRKNFKIRWQWSKRLSIFSNFILKEQKIEKQQNRDIEFIFIRQWMIIKHPILDCEQN